MLNLEDVRERFSGLLPNTLGMEFTAVEPDRIVATLMVRPEVCTGGDILHGGAIMAIADTVGAVGCAGNLREGQGTTTLESKTNFFAPAPVGTTVTAESLPLHKGGRTHVWQTTIRREDGKMVAQVTQTQMVLQR